MEKIKLEKQEILVGSSRLSGSNRKSFDRVKYFLENMEFNKSYIYKIKNNPNNKDTILEELKKKYESYRKNWTGISKHYDIKDNFDSHLNNIHDPAHRERYQL